MLFFYAPQSLVRISRFAALVGFMHQVEWRLHDVDNMDVFEGFGAALVHGEQHADECQQTDVASESRPKVVHMCAERVITVIYTGKIQNPLPNFFHIAIVNA